MASKKVRDSKRLLLTAYKDAVKGGGFAWVVKYLDDLIKYKVDFNLRADESLRARHNPGMNIMEWFSQQRLHEELFKIIKTGPRLDEFTPSGRTLLSANSHNEPTVVRALLEAGANPNLHDRHGCLPLGCSVISAYQFGSGAEECARLLLAHGADPDLLGDGNPLFIDPVSSLDMALVAANSGGARSLAAIVGMLKAKHEENALIAEPMTAKGPSVKRKPGI